MVETKKISSTQTNSSVTFSPLVNYIIIKNIGGYPAYLNFNGVATTSHFKIDPSETLEIGLKNLETVQSICDTGRTTTLTIVGYTI